VISTVLTFLLNIYPTDEHQKLCPRRHAFTEVGSVPRGSPSTTCYRMSSIISSFLP
jgi:hypothetical protein